ncbi:MAG: LLM class flavin-dependent oxidoreductase [Gammaproteobacteria bacterium]|jgi:5,10-methylenetetrahydromethanopterin reductase|nr:LLM class flavin-dependent oxidoreductase [Gammaproteobacteria bacterium]
MRIDVIIESNLSAEEFLRLGSLAEEFGLRAIWVPNNANGRDAFVNFAPLALQHGSIRMGPIAVSPFELHPYKMAISLLTLNELAAGRAQIVVGGGGGTLEAMGQKPRRMVRAVRESLEILQAAAAGATLSYQGEVFAIPWLDTRWVTQAAPRVYAGANGPQMLRTGARYADGIMVSDFTPERVSWARQIIDPVLAGRGIDLAVYPVNNFWAWHVKPTREAALREARIWLCVRGTIYPDYIHDVVDADEARIVTDHLASFTQAYYNKSPEIEGVPDEIIDKICVRGTSASSYAELDHEIERFQAFAAAGLTEIALKVYAEPEAAIRTIGEYIVPAVQDRQRL